MTQPETPIPLYAIAYNDILCAVSATKQKERNIMTETTPNLTDHSRIMLSAVQHRANNHGFAIAMRKAPTSDTDIRRVAQSLDSIITYLD